MTTALALLRRELLLSARHGADTMAALLSQFIGSGALPEWAFAEPEPAAARPVSAP